MDKDLLTSEGVIEEGQDSNFAAKADEEKKDDKKKNVLSAASQRVNANVKIKMMKIRKSSQLMILKTKKIRKTKTNVLTVASQKKNALVKRIKRTKKKNIV